jgi:photosystem II stability/assembly factor-like uncharacterized protein
MNMSFEKRVCSKSLGFWAAAILLSGLMFTGCLHSARNQDSSSPVLSLRMGVSGVNALGKSSVITLDKLVIVISSSANDTILDTLTSSTTPSLNTVSTSPQVLTKNYVLPALRTWKIVVTSRDVLDSAIHRDSAVSPVLYAGDTGVVSLDLSAKFSMYDARFLTIPDSIASSTGTHKQILTINRLVLKINDAVVRDSTATPGPFFTALSTHALTYDYVSYATGSWTAVTSGTTQDLYGVAFGVADTGFVFGDNMTLKTVDGGITWEEKGYAPLIMRAGVALSGYSAYAAGDFGILTFTHSGGEDGGAAFVPEPDFPEAATNPVFYGLAYPTASIGYAAGAAGHLWKTTDSALSWTQLTSGTSEDLKAVHFIDVNNGWAAGNAGTILVTTDAGANWSAQTSGTGADLNGIRFVSASVGWAVGSGGVILKTVNAGASWATQTSGTTQRLNGLYPKDANTVYAVGDNGVIVRTTNGGSTWITQTTPTSQTLRGLFFVGDKGYAVGDAGTILSLVPGNHLIEMLAYGPMAAWSEADPLFRGSAMITAGAGQDSTVALQLNWAGPTTGTGKLDAVIGRVGTVIIEGEVPDTVDP